MLNALPSLFLCIQIGPRNKTHMCSGSRVGSSLNGPLLISTPLIWRLMGFLHWALRWVTWPRKDPLQPSTLPPVRETDRMVKGMVLFFVICMILKLQESNSLWLQRFNHYCLFSEHEINYRKEERKKNWVRQACVCVWEIVSVLFGLRSVFSYHFLWCTIYAAQGKEKQCDNQFTVVIGTIHKHY